jgi:hypothetical protein
MKGKKNSLSGGKSAFYRGEFIEISGYETKIKFYIGIIYENIVTPNNM